MGYKSHSEIMAKYKQYDGFVHIASEINHPHLLDGKYTATLLEAGLTGAILFWHDTFQLGNDFETIFSLSKDPAVAANELINIKNSIDVEKHSQKTWEEIADRCDPSKIAAFRKSIISKLI